MSELLEARGIRKSFPWRQGWGRPRRLQALAGVDLTVRRGECLAVVGESGSGKSTLGRCLLRLSEPDSGVVRFAGKDVTAMSRRELRDLRTEMQMIFQDTAGTLDPRWRVAAQIAEPIRSHHLRPREEVLPRVHALLETVGLAVSVADRYPHQLSGGQRQRVGIARALATDPKLLVLDEPISALDVSVRARILGLLVDLKERLSLTMIFIAHDLAMVQQIADSVAVMYLGRIVESGPCRDVLGSPRHPYTAGLLRSVPVPDPERLQPLETVRGEIPSPLDPPSGCVFHPRCAVAHLESGDLRPRCRDEAPAAVPAAGEHGAACHYPVTGSSL